MNFVFLSEKVGSVGTSKELETTPSSVFPLKRKGEET